MIPRVIIGGLSQRGKIQTYTSVTDDGGGRTKTWVDTATVWMRIEPLKGEEQMFGMQLEGRVTHKITMRYRTLTPDQRIVHKGNSYNIRGIPLNEESRDRKLIVMCEQGVAT